MGFVIEKNVEIPSAGVTQKKYPLRELEVGDSFFVPGENAKAIGRVRNAAFQAGKVHGLAFTCRVVTESGVRGIRVWRTE